MFFKNLCVLVLWMKITSRIGRVDVVTIKEIRDLYYKDWRPSAGDNKEFTASLLDFPHLAVGIEQSRLKIWNARIKSIYIYTGV